MKLSKYTLLAALAALMGVFVLGGCTAEETAEGAENAAEKTEGTLEGVTEDAGDAVDDATDSAGETLENAGDAAGETLDNAGEAAPTEGATTDPAGGHDHDGDGHDDH